MANKKEKLSKSDKRVMKIIDEQTDRLETVKSKFYPNGIRAEFHLPSQLKKVMTNSPSLRQFSEDEPMRAECARLYNDSEIKGSRRTMISLYYAMLFFKGSEEEFGYSSYKARVMFKAESDDTPVFLQEEFISEPPAAAPSFLLDPDAMKAFLIIEDVVETDTKSEFKEDDASFAALSELSGILYDKDKETGKIKCFMIYFSKADNICYIERVFAVKSMPLDQLLAPTNLDYSDNDSLPRLTGEAVPSPSEDADDDDD